MQDVLDAIGRIDSYTGGSLRAALDDVLVRDAVLYNFLIIGEAIKHIPAELRQRAEDVNWSGAAGMRDVLMHKYYRTDLERVKSLDGELFRLKAGVEHLLRGLGEA